MSALCADELAGQLSHGPIRMTGWADPCPACGQSIAGRGAAGGHRHYIRRQLAFAQRIRELFDEGHNLAATIRILSLQDLAAERAITADLRRQLSDAHPSAPGPSGTR
jgi:hypothetical protein